MRSFTIKVTENEDNGNEIIKSQKITFDITLSPNKLCKVVQTQINNCFGMISDKEKILFSNDHIHNKYVISWNGKFKINLSSDEIETPFILGFGIKNIDLPESPYEMIEPQYGGLWENVFIFPYEHKNVYVGLFENDECDENNSSDCEEDDEESDNDINEESDEESSTDDKDIFIIKGKISKIDCYTKGLVRFTIDVDEKLVRNNNHKKILLQSVYKTDVYKTDVYKNDD